MELSWNESQTELRERYLRFGQERILTTSEERDRASSFSRELWEELAEWGFWRVHVAKEWGGDGGDIWDHVAAFEGLAEGSGDCGFVLSAAAHAGLLQLILMYGTDNQREEFLPGLLSGQVGATACTELSGGSHVAAVQTLAVESEPGEFLVSGHKSHITNAPIADLMMIVARVKDLGSRDISLFLVAADQDGVELGDHEDLLGLRTSPVGPITLRSVKVGPNRVIGQVGEGLDLLYWCLAFDRLIYGIVVAAVLGAMIPIAVDRAISRESFGVPLAEHQYIQEKIVGMKLALEASRGLSFSAINALQHGDPQASTLASCAKLLAANGIVDSSLELVQLFGHLGCEKSIGIERYLRDAVAFRIAGGTDEMQKKNIFKQILVQCADAPHREINREPTKSPWRS